MPYDNILDLPASIRRNVPEHAQVIYEKAYNNAWEEYRNPEDRRGNATQEEVAREVA
ncbi:MAG: ChaB family protein [Chloroflexi bacterium]|nr:ChaB family protein [Chloroflexota bacterium]